MILDCILYYMLLVQDQTKLLHCFWELVPVDNNGGSGSYLYGL